MDQQQRQETAAHVHAAMKKRGWSQETLARHAGVAPNTVLGLLRGKQTQEGKLRAIRAALDLGEPEPPVLSLVDVPEDVAAFVKVFVRRMAALPEANRARLLARLYPQVIAED
jgi:transcriptional regulator with XRE-family HTH domain